MARSQSVLAAVILQAIIQVASAGVAQDLIHHRGIDNETPGLATPAETIIMTPIPNFRPGNTKRDRITALSLKPSETFYWTASDGTIAEFKFETPGKHENIVNLEAIDDMVREIQCPPPQSPTSNTTTTALKLRFAEEADFDDAQDIWKWVNQDQSNHFTLVVGAGACGWNRDRRVLYDVTDLVYNDEAETATLHVQQTTWKAAAHTYDLTIGQLSDLPPSTKRQVVSRKRAGRRRRGLFDDIKSGFDNVVDGVKGGIKDGVDTVKDGVSDVVDDVKDGVSDVVDDAKDSVSGVVDDVKDGVSDVVDGVKDGISDIGDILSGSPDFTIPFDNDFNAKSLTFSSNGLSVTALCKTCTSSGSFAIKGRFKATLLKMEEAWVEVSTEGIEAKAVMGLTLKGDLAGPLASKAIPIFKFSPAGVAIPGLLTIGPTVGVSLGAEIGAVSGGLALGFGGTATIPASSSRWDFLDENGMSSSGWEATFEAEPFTADVFVQTSASVFLRAAVGLEISAVETGFAAEMTANIPSLTATLKGISSLTCTACGNFQEGIQGSLTLGTNIGVSLKKKIGGSESTLWSLTFADSSLPQLAGFCQGLGPQGDQCPTL